LVLKVSKRLKESVAPMNAVPDRFLNGFAEHELSSWQA
jgi:hypothetical protein